MKETLDLITPYWPIIPAVIGASGVYLAFRSFRVARRSAEVGRSALNLSGLLDVMLREYLERDFTATEAPLVPNTESGNVGNLVQKETQKRFKNLRAAKTWAWGTLEGTIDPKTEQFACGQDKWLDWRQKSSVDMRDSKNNRTWENLIAFETAWALNQLGFICSSGLVPLGVILGNASETILDDWILCRPWVDTYRAREKVRGRKNREMDFHRRHAEWLALVAFFWMSGNWRYPKENMLLSSYEDGKSDPTKIMRRRLVDLTKVDRDLIPKLVQHEVKKLAQIGFWDWYGPVT
jgi:hypothetical protein